VRKLLAIPIPAVYISQERGNKEYVIDGQQRLTSFFSLMDGMFPDGSSFKLRGLKVFRELNDTEFRNLTALFGPAEAMTLRRTRALCFGFTQSHIFSTILPGTQADT
jgi:hypothetical protein